MTARFVFPSPLVGEGEGGGWIRNLRSQVLGLGRCLGLALGLVALGAAAESGWAQGVTVPLAPPRGGQAPQAAPPPTLPPGAPPSAPVGSAVALLQGLDKVSGRIQSLEAPIGKEIRFGTLAITARACDKRPPEEPPDNLAFLEIREIRPREEPRAVFTGWMLASSPALSALEHPVYDVWVIDCRISGPPTR